MSRIWSNVAINRREPRRIFLLKFHAMHVVNHLPWPDCAAVYEAETGERITDDQLRLRVKRAVEDTTFVRVVELPKKVVVSVFELTLVGCIWCSIRKWVTKVKGLFRRKAKQ